jgi:hypothetical protein
MSLITVSKAESDRRLAGSEDWEIRILGPGYTDVEMRMVRSGDILRYTRLAKPLGEIGAGSFYYDT